MKKISIALLLLAFVQLLHAAGPALQPSIQEPLSTSIAEIKRQYPDLDGLDDNQVVDVLHSVFYADLPREQVAKALGVTPIIPKELKRLGFMGKWRYASCQENAIKAPTELGVIQGLHLCQNQFGQ